MRRLNLTTIESKELLETGSVEIERNGFPMLLEINPYYDESLEEDCLNPKYYITIMNIYDKVSINKKGK